MLSYCKGNNLEILASPVQKKIEVGSIFQDFGFLIVENKCIIQLND
jgi:hypothetical protein